MYNLSHKPLKGTVQCCGGNDTNTVRQLCNIDSGLTLNTIMHFNYFTSA